MRKSFNGETDISRVEARLSSIVTRGDSFWDKFGNDN